MVLNVLRAGTPSLMSVALPVAVPQCGLTARTIPSFVARLPAVDGRESAGAAASKKEVRRRRNMTGIRLARWCGLRRELAYAHPRCVAFKYRCRRRWAVRLGLEKVLRCYVNPDAPRVTLIIRSFPDSSPRLSRVSRWAEVEGRVGSSIGPRPGTRLPVKRNTGRRLVIQRERDEHDVTFCTAYIG